MTLLALLSRTRGPATPAPVPHVEGDGDDRKVVYPHHGTGVVAGFTRTGTQRSTAAWSRMPGRTRQQKRAHLAVLRRELIKRKRALKAES